MSIKYCANGMSRKFPREYKSYLAMRTRCFCKKHAQYKNYGGRGITVCQRWLEPLKGFEHFLADMGKRPIGTSLDRINNLGNYSPKNCRWATAKEQSNNTSANIRWKYKNKTHTISEWSLIYGIPSRILYNRVKLYGWSIEKALTFPYVPKPHHN